MRDWVRFMLEEIRRKEREEKDAREERMRRRQQREEPDADRPAGESRDDADG